MELKINSSRICCEGSVYDVDVCRCYIMKKLCGTRPFCVERTQGVADPRVPPLGINYVGAGEPPSYYCLIDSQTNGSRLPFQ